MSETPQEQWQEMAARVARAEDRTMSAEAERDALRDGYHRRKDELDAQYREILRLRDIISPGDAAAYEQGMAALQARAERAEAALMDALHDCALTYDAAGDLDYLSRAVEAEAALRWCDEFAPGIVEQARAALRDPAPAEEKP